MAQSLFKTLRACYPEMNIDVLAPAWTESLLVRMSEVREIIVQPVGHGRLALGERYRLGRRLRKAAYDWSLILPNSWKSALIPYFARIPRRSGFLGEFRYGLLNDVRHLNRQESPSTVQRFVTLGLSKKAGVPDLNSLPIPQLQVDQKRLSASIKRLELDGSRPALALCPGAEYGPAKRWPPEYFAAIARYYNSQGWQSWIFGSDRDRSIAEAVCHHAGPGCINLAGKTSLEEVVDLMSACQAVVSNDSGLMHLAAAIGRPLVAIFGSSDPGFTPPLAMPGRFFIERLDLECSPCFERECPLGHLRCLRGLHPERIMRALDTLVA